MITITSQPSVGKLMAAYRPIVIQATVTGTPPVVYCDIYIAGSYYKTVSRTQAPYQFDIQDAVQEYIQKFIPSNGGSNVETDILHEVYVKIRSSSTDANGFIQPDTPEPIQATGTTSSVPGGGTLSNVFWAVNAVLQHEDNQDLETHLNSFKTGSWANNTFPLTHRPSKYKLCKLDSDFFPMVVKGNNVGCIRLNYKLKGQNVFHQSTNCTYGCVPVSFTVSSIPDAFVGVPYSHSIDLTGSAPFNIDSITKPSWMSANIIGSNLVLTGTPTSADTSELSFQISNCATVNTQTYAGTINSIVLSCGVTLSALLISVIETSPIYVYTITWTNSGGTPLFVNLEVSFDGGTTWESPNSGAQTSDTSWSYDLGSSIAQSHKIRLKPYCAINNPGVPSQTTYLPPSTCTTPVLSSVAFDSSGNIVLTWVNNSSWLTMNVQYSYDGLTWNSLIGPATSSRNIGVGLNNTGSISFRLIGNCSSMSSSPSNVIEFDSTYGSAGVGGNILIMNNAIGATSISSVTPLFYSISSGSFSLNTDQKITGTHSGYTGAISVQATGASASDSLSLFINGALMQIIFVGTTSGIFDFASVTIEPTDNVLIRLTN